MSTKTSFTLRASGGPNGPPYSNSEVCPDYINQALSMIVWQDVNSYVNYVSLKKEKFLAASVNFVWPSNEGGATISFVELWVSKICDHWVIFVIYCRKYIDLRICKKKEKVNYNPTLGSTIWILSPLILPLAKLNNGKRLNQFWLLVWQQLVRPWRFFSIICFFRTLSSPFYLDSII